MDWTRATGLLVAILVACGDSGDSTTSASTTDAGTSGVTPTTSAGTSTGGTSTGGGVGDWDQCTQITIEPLEVSQIMAVGIIPQPAGGAIADGTYLLTSYEVFGSAGLTSDTLSGVLVFAGPAYQVGTLNVAANGTVSAAGSDLTLTAECSCSRVLGDCDMTVQTPVTQPYTFFEDTLLLFSDYINGGTALATYKKQ